jgi:hypothetical protein
VYFTEDEENYICDTYIFKSVTDKSGGTTNPLARFSYLNEIKKLTELNDFSRESIAEEMQDNLVQVGTLN